MAPTSHESGRSYPATVLADISSSACEVSSPATFELVARAAAARIKRALTASPDEPVLFAVFDFDPPQIRQILEQIHQIEPAARIAIHPDLVDGEVPSVWISSEPLAHWRNVTRQDVDRAIVSAVSTDDLDRLGETAATIYGVSPDKLRADIDAWFDVCPHLRQQTARDTDYLRRAIQGLQRTEAIGGIAVFADFIALLDKAVDQEAVHKALNRATTALRIPPGAANFQPPGDRGRLTSPESWATQFTDLYNHITDVAYLRNDKGAPLDRIALLARLNALQEEGEIGDDDAEKIRALLDDRDIEPGAWRDSQRDFVTLQWTVIQRVVKARKTAREERLGRATVAFIDREFASALNHADRDILERLEETRPADPEEKALFSRFVSKIERDRKLLRRWEQFVFREVRTHTDLQTGILRSAYELLGSAGSGTDDQIVCYRLSKANELDFWRRHLLETSLCLRDRYRGLQRSLPDFIQIDCGICWSRNWADEINAAEGHSGHEAEYKFEVYLLRRADLAADGAVDPAKLDHAIKTQMIWTPAARGVGVNFADHIRAAIPNGSQDVQLMSGRFSRTSKDTTSGTTALKLTDRRTIDDVNEGDEGLLFDPNDSLANIAKTFCEQLALLAGRGVLSAERRDRIGAAFSVFADAYGCALRAFRESDGVGAFDPALIEQARTYATLLETLRADAPSDACKRALWAPAMQLGVALSRNVPGAIVTPLNPFRLAEIGLKAALTVEALQTIKANSDDPGLRSYTDRIEADLQRSWFSDFLVLPKNEAKFVAMSENQFLDDYSYVEPLAEAEAGDEQGAYTKQAADNLMKVLSEHLDLHPHNTANFSVVLYNSESRDLPSAVAERLARRVDEDERLRCDLIIASDDLKRLRQIYAEQNVAIGRELETSGGTDLTKEFLSSLRVGIGDIEQLAVSDNDHKPHDVAFLLDVFARNAKLRWRRCTPEFGWPNVDLSTRAAPSRRQVHGPGENKTRILLVSPSRPGALQAYLDLAMELADSAVEDADRRDRWEPIQEITFDLDDNSRVIDRAHKIADWVVTFDAIADRRLFRQNHISVIRSVPIDEVRHNLVVSTSAHRRSLAKRIGEMLSNVTGRMAADEGALARTLIDRAADISGQIVLRAANRDTSALELVGLSLSQQLVRSSLPEGASPLAWFFLDDFKTRFGHLPGDEVADILLVTASEVEGERIVTMSVIEAKCVGADSAPKAREKSRAQTESTLDRMRARYGAVNDPLNSKAYTSALADLLVEHGTYDHGEDSQRLQSWIRVIRDNAVRFNVEGISFVFVHDDIGAPAPSSFDDGFKQVSFSRSEMAQVLEDVRAARPSSPLTNPLSEGDGPLDLAPPVGAEPRRDTSQSPIRAAGDDISQSHGGEAAASPSVADAPELGTTESEVTPSPPSGGLRAGVVAMISDRAVPVAEIEGQAWLQTATNRLKAALKGYGLVCDVVGTRLTPNSALVRFRGSEGMTVDAVQKRIPTLLTSHALEIVAVRPAKGEVVVMVGRDSRVILSTLDLWARRQLPETAPLRNTSFVLGEREDNGEILYLNLGGPFAGQPQHGPHTLIAGETGGGKGVFTANLLLDICATNSPSEARIWLVDPKAGIDYSWIEHTPHLDGSIVTTPDDAIAALKALVEEMERRYADVLAPTKSPNLDAYNSRVLVDQRLPRIYFFHDELADWMADKADGRYRDAVSDYVVRLSGKARAAGIHLFLITQRPDKDALPGLIKANMNNKIALKVSNRLNSQIILDEPGAEGLLGHGHMIAKLANQPGGLIYAQAPYLAPDEAVAVAQAIAED